MKRGLLYGLTFLLIPLVTAEVGLRLGLRKTSHAKFIEKLKKLSEVSQARRVLLLGDSFTAKGSGYGEHLCRLLMTEKDTHCLNLGQSGTGPVAYYQQLQKYVSHYRPTHVVVGYYVGNDLTDTRNISRRFAEKKPKRFLENFELYHYIQDKREFYAYWEFLEKANSAMESSNIKKESILNPALAIVSKEHPDYLVDNLLMNKPYLEKAWENVRRVFGEIDRLAKESSAKLLFVAFPRSVQINRSHYEFWKGLGIQTDTRFLSSAIPQDRLRTYCQENQFECFDLLPELRKRNKKTFYLEKDDHFNEEGKELAAQLIFEEIN